MQRFITFTLPLALIGGILVFLVGSQATCSQESMQDKQPATLPATLPAVPEGYETATFAAGCYWCVEAVYQRLDGVHAATSGFIGGHVENPGYEAVCNGTTGHAEAVQLIYNPKKISYATLLDWFWRLHDPTQLNRQGADVGTQYRSAIFYHNESQKKEAAASRDKAQESFAKPIVTEITKAGTFYTAKVSHQDYYKINGNKNPYCKAVIAPKLKKLKLDR
ncbi:peptide-methionine (S)-S-oxide reductase MsrA [Verrucomicrobiaceae bacterium N1E253]|uniref:Peptide methionine sulfoxide reductase MsrA n=1 Tax=Oceaniferula marina TaxID=2748318 RepID=A0A851GG12_9BACT|nr:peptide-methionine (S)-S-oxide reductase MsrA [Oceaniferula marina]NWK54741.1 peptide-methionine (S)-S-oxide reductase MsrA [Oceaniferula marina]